jgi:Fe-S-cluster containining protein
MIIRRNPMVETFYLHLEYKGKNNWSINLPFLCTKCGVCCTLDDFLTAGETKAKPDLHPQVHAKIKELFTVLGEMWEASEAKYEKYVRKNPCPFLLNKSCSIYDIRPEGCRLFPNTAFGMLTQDCEALNRLKKMKRALKKGRSTKETYYFTQKTRGATREPEPIISAKFNEKQYLACITKLREAGMTDDELGLFNCINKKKS